MYIEVEDRNHVRSELTKCIGVNNVTCSLVA